MSETEKTSNVTGASGAGWSEREKIAYLLVLCETDGRVEAKIGNAPIPVGRSVIACKRMMTRLKEKHKKDMEKIKNSQPLDAGTDGESEVPKTPKKRKAKGTDGDADAAAAEEEEGSPKKKKATPRKRKSAAAVEETVKKEECDSV